jgi:hypothetical protein
VALLYKRPVKIAAIVGADTSFLKPILQGSTEVEEYVQGDDINVVLNRIGKAEVLLATPDSTVYNTENIRNILLSTYRHNQGVIGFSADMVKAGALATTYSDIERHQCPGGRDRQGFVASGELPAPQFPRYFSTIVNDRRGKSLARTRRHDARSFERRPPPVRRHEPSGIAGASARAWSSSPCCRWCSCSPSFVWYSWYSHRAQVAEELSERGRILAKALAETSEYNVISGNLSDLRLTINGLVQSDKSIYRIDVVDADQKAPSACPRSSPPTPNRTTTKRRSRSR